MGFQLFFTYKGVQTFPFFNYGMFSRIEKPKETYTSYRILINQHEFDWTAPRVPKLVIVQILRYYGFLDSRNFVDPNIEVIRKRFNEKVPDEILNYMIREIANGPESRQEFQKWLLKYIDQFTEEKVLNIKVDSNEYVFGEDGLPELRLTRKLFYYEAK